MDSDNSQVSCQSASTRLHYWRGGKRKERRKKTEELKKKERERERASFKNKKRAKAYLVLLALCSTAGLLPILLDAATVLLLPTANCCCCLASDGLLLLLLIWYALLLRHAFFLFSFFISFLCQANPPLSLSYPPTQNSPLFLFIYIFPLFFISWLGSSVEKFVSVTVSVCPPN